MAAHGNVNAAMPAPVPGPAAVPFDQHHVSGKIRAPGLQRAAMLYSVSA